MRGDVTGLLRSYLHGGGQQPLQGMTVGDVLDRAAMRWPAREALLVPHQGVRWSWRKLRSKAWELASGLLALGLKPGDRIGMLAPNRAEWVLVQFGTAYAGLILVNINPAYRPPELEYVLNGDRRMDSAARWRTRERRRNPRVLPRQALTLQDSSIHSVHG